MSVEYTFDDEALDAALEIMEKTVFKAKKLAIIIFSAAFTVMCIIAAICTGDPSAYISFIIPAVTLLCLSSFRKEFIDSRTSLIRQNILSRSRSLGLYNDGILIYAKYSSDLSEYSDDAEYVEYVKEMDEEMSYTEYFFGKFRVYESDSAVMIYSGRDQCETILKKYISASQLSALKESISESKRWKYIATV